MKAQQAHISTALTSLLKVTHPIMCAPMAGMSMGALAGAVAKAGGVGLIGIGASRVFGPERVKSEYALAKKELAKSGITGGGALGFGFLENFMDEESGDESFQACLELNPDVVFLSGYTPSKTNYSTKKWIQRVREQNKTAKVVVQTFSVSEAVAAASCGADIVVIQGVDAGGHGRQNRVASIVSLVPQARLSLNENGFSECVLLAAGGIANGAQMAAALALGADGVLMGSAFVVTKESSATESFKHRIFDTKDGTSGTTVSVVWDQLSKMGKPFLEGEFVGRALADSEAVSRFEGKHPKTEISGEDKDWYAKSDYNVRAVWCSSSSGLLRSPIDASTMVERTVEEAIQTLRAPKNFQIGSPCS